MIEVHGLVKRYGGKTAVNGLTFTVQPGVVTGFLGPNGAGKSTTAALLADPQILILDEPVNGLDIEGVRWVRHLLKDLARQGRTVFVSSHLMSEMAQTADHLIVIGRGELIADTSVTEFIQRATVSSVRVRTPEAARLRDLIAGPEVTVSSDVAGVLTVTGMASDQVGITAAGHGITVYELVPQQASLEEAFLELTQDTVEYKAPDTSTELAGAGRNPA